MGFCRLPHAWPCFSRTAPCASGSRFWVRERYSCADASRICSFCSRGSASTLPDVGGPPGGKGKISWLIGYKGDPIIFFGESMVIYMYIYIYVYPLFHIQSTRFSWLYPLFHGYKWGFNHEKWRYNEI